MFIANVCSFNAEIKVHEWILATHSVNKLIVSAAVLLELVQMTGVVEGMLLNSCPGG